MIITIDGPAGSGKSSTAKKVAEKLGWQYLDSGSLYRTFALLFINYAKNKDRFLENISQHSVGLTVEGETVITTLNGEDIGDRIRTQAVSEQVSFVAALPVIRDEVNRIMREVVETYNFVADGRDLGSVVFPDAVIKFFMIADIEERAKRRFNELKQKNMDASFDEILENLEKRDRQDSERAIAPLVKPLNAIEIDTTLLNFDDQVNQMVTCIRRVI